MNVFIIFKYSVYMLQYNINTSILKENMINFNSLKQRLQEMFPSQYKSDVEQYIASKDPKSAADVEHWIQQWTYSNERYLGL
jgi:hypothetical protein